MKLKLLSAVVVTAIGGAAYAADDAALATDTQKFSYAVGIQIAQSLVRQGVEIDPKAFQLAVEDALAGKEPRLSPDVMQSALESQGQKAQEKVAEMAKSNLDAGKAFLADNKKKDGVTELANGIQYVVLESGQGKSPSTTSSVTVNYAGRLIDGREFDSSYRRNEPFTLQVDSVIKGWQEVLPLMKEGDKWTVFIPSELAYGERGAGAAIGPNEVLVFDIELLKVN